jgi:hypothetical protein
MVCEGTDGNCQGGDGSDTPSLPDDSKVHEEDNLDNEFVRFFDGAAEFTTFLASLVDITFASAEVVLTGGGCVAGGLAGCGAGYLESLVMYNAGPNEVENALSVISFMATGFADVLDDGKSGEDTKTALTTTVAGAIAGDPIVDFVIDFYALGYAERDFYGITPIFNGGPLLAKPFTGRNNEGWSIWK